MALERPLDNYMARPERPETSKFSRNSRRSEFQTTMTDFNINSDNLSKNQLPGNKKGDTQTKFYTTKTKFNKTNSFNSTFYPTDKNNAQKRLDDSKEHSEPDHFPELKDTHTNDTRGYGVEGISNSVDLKPGMTLDKFLGASFKKIDVFDTNLKEFERQNSYNDDIIEEKTNEMSDNDAKEYQYESFEILETDDEDEASELKDAETGKDPARTNQRRETSDFQENHEILSKIQNKYKSSKPKFLPKNKLKGFRVRSPLKEKRQEINNDNNINQETNFEVSKRKRDLTPTRSESESPQFGSSLNSNSNKPLPVRFNNSKGFMDIPHASLHDTDHKTGESPSESQSGFRKTNQNPFYTTKENFRNTSEKFRTTMMKKTFYQKSSLPTNATVGSGIYEDAQEQDYEHEKVGGRSHSLAGPLKPSENMNKFDKGYGTGLEQKYMKETKMITDKIKQNEKEMMDKYAKMFKLNQQEMMSLCNNNEKKSIGGPKRLSTPLKDFNCSRNFQKRKIINL